MNQLQLFPGASNDDAFMASALETSIEEDNSSEVLTVNLPPSGKVKLICEGLNIEVELNLAKLLSKPPIDKTMTGWLDLKSLQHHNTSRRDSLISLASLEPPSNTFPFFNLPGELRNQIYHSYTTSLLPSQPHTFTLTTSDSGLHDYALQEKTTQDPSSDLSTFLSQIHTIPLLRVSSQSRAEYSSHLFSSTPLELHGLIALQDCFHHLHACYLAQIITLRITLLECLDLKDPVYEKESYLADLLAPCKNLRYLHIEYKIGIESLLTELSPANRRDCFEPLVADSGRAKANRVGAFVGLSGLRERGVRVGLEGSVRLRFRGESGFVAGEDIEAGEGFERELARVVAKVGF